MCLGTATFCLRRKVAPRLAATWEPFAVCPRPSSLFFGSTLFLFPSLVYLRFSYKFIRFLPTSSLSITSRLGSCFLSLPTFPLAPCRSVPLSFSLPLSHSLSPSAATWPLLFGFSNFYLFFVCRFLLMFCELLLPSLHFSPFSLPIVVVLDFLRSIFVCVCLFHRLVLCILQIKKEGKERRVASIAYIFHLLLLWSLSPSLSFSLSPSV